ncbi:enoyl-CoA hydratase-related protein [Achromobacter denitrificans]|uniref:enoyl-CoA hydratase/isomerase family protein n=1 Tax=Achromobacter denitrificans TaxID=32002 RepID=UPI0023E7E61E|nr:enoyl-CoA hydratase-related protein [Achromobacter denitrificans]MDF3860810.1 enoyl-CoA hydratase-related protein [Achromobacter denitrificans]
METLALRESRLDIGTEGVAVFHHLRGEARSPLSMALRADYADMLAALHERQVRALVLAGGEGGFCAGGDVKAMQGRLADGSQSAGVRERLQDMHVWLQQLRDLEIPVIAAVDGPAWGGGFALALCADFILATPRASFCMVFLRIGALPDMGALHLLPRAVGLHKAKELLMTGRRVSAQEGQSLGFVHALHEPEALQAEALTLARRFLPAPRVALGLTKRLANRAYELPPAVMAELEACAQVACLAEPDHAEALDRFVRKQPMRYNWDLPDQPA